ncbi:ATP-binding cassette domain-containing protein [Bacterioplanoides pacificum]|uniref:ATP-binding cassette domain-containing protein n=1 Tax=Bacterioplanoides pacificum TaxID=1171596 RepID=A0ABV7VM24_9GAMM
MMTLDQLGLSKGNTPILQNISARLPAGQLTMLVGPNGAGKSTLLSLLAGLSLPSAGGLQFAGDDTRHWTRQRWAQQVTLVPQLSQMGFPLSVREVVELGGLAHATSVVQLREATRQALADWDIGYLADKEVRLLSGGEQQRTQLARSWIQIQQPGSRLWLLDEPLSALDLRHQRQCLERVRQLQASGKSILMVVHDLNLALRYADRVLMLCCGELVADGPPDQVLTAERVSQVFQVETRLSQGYLHWL